LNEFQNISSFDDPYPSKKLRANWAIPSKCLILLYGSKRHMMMEMFTNSKYAFLSVWRFVFP